MGSFSIWHWLIVLAVVLLLFGGRGKISALDGRFRQGPVGLQEGRRRAMAPTRTPRRPASRAIRPSRSRPRPRPRRRARCIRTAPPRSEAALEASRADPMFGIDSPELLVIAVVALVVIGPKELPGLLRTLGQVDGQDARHGVGVPRPCRRDGAPVRARRGEEAARRSAGGLDLQSLDPTKQIKSTSRRAWPRARKPVAEAKCDPRQSAGRARVGAASRRVGAADRGRTGAGEIAPELRRRSLRPKLHLP